MITLEEALTNEQLKAFLDKYNIACRVFDALRIVNPIKKEVCSYQHNHILTSHTKCYGVWTGNRICDNCISTRAYHEQQEIMKFEYDHHIVHLIIAIPFTYDGNSYVFELLKNVTDSWIAPHLQSNKEVLLTDLIEHLNFVASKDELTKVYKKSYINERLSTDFYYAQQEANHLSIAMIDFDHFKYINDNFGHLAGDYLLEKFGELLLKHIDVQSSWAARFGGDEFILVFNNLPRPLINEKLETIRTELSSTLFEFDHKTFKSTISIGIAHYNPVQQEFSELVALADKNMYVAKKLGGNTIIE